MAPKKQKYNQNNNEDFHDQNENQETLTNDIQDHPEEIESESLQSPKTSQDIDDRNIVLTLQIKRGTYERTATINIDLNMLENMSKSSNGINKVNKYLNGLIAASSDKLADFIKDVINR